jgi:hypothetical protein
MILMVKTNFTHLISKALRIEAAAPNFSLGLQRIACYTDSYRYAQKHLPNRKFEQKNTWQK